MTADTLSDVLRTIRLSGATFFRVAARAPWVAEQPGPEIILPKILPGASHMIAYHVVIEGRCFANLIGGAPIALEAGEAIVFTRGDPHVMSSSPGMRGDPFSPGVIDAATRGQLPFFINFGGSGPISARVVCGFLACNARAFNPLLESLPPVVKAGDSRSSNAGRLGQLIDWAIIETAEHRAGGESVLAKLSELMFIEVVRRYLESLPPERAGWLAGLRDPFVGKALSVMHGATARSWTTEQLAKEVGVSRSVLAQRFRSMVGIPPMQYLVKWRMQVASELLSRGSAAANEATIATEIGYGSVAAFSRAFKKVVGVSPSEWRRQPGHGPPLVANRDTSALREVDVRKAHVGA
jgi:AraC-like DNA-binding protein